MIELNVTNLVGGNIVITTGGSAPAGHADTWVKYSGDTEWTPVSIQGSIEGSWDDNIGWISTTQIPNVSNVVELEIGTGVTSIGDFAFLNLDSLTSVTIPNSVTYIGMNAFDTCNSLSNVTFLGKTMEQVQEMDNYGWDWGINPSIINVA